jgi:hypothetical protein
MRDPDEQAGRRATVRLEGPGPAATRLWVRRSGLSGMSDALRDGFGEPRCATGAQRDGMGVQLAGSRRPAGCGSKSIQPYRGQ